MTKNERLTVPSNPPSKPERQRRSRWTDLFAECRKCPGQWRRVIDPLAKSTASQIASDVRNAHNREPEKSRLRGLQPNERWAAVWGQDPTAENPEAHYLWLKFLGPDHSASSQRAAA